MIGRGERWRGWGDGSGEGEWWGGGMVGRESVGREEWWEGESGNGEGSSGGEGRVLVGRQEGEE